MCPCLSPAVCVCLFVRLSARVRRFGLFFGWLLVCLSLCLGQAFLAASCRGGHVVHGRAIVDLDVFPARAIAIPPRPALNFPSRAAIAPRHYVEHVNGSSSGRGHHKRFGVEACPLDNQAERRNLCPSRCALGEPLQTSRVLTFLNHSQYFVLPTLFRQNAEQGPRPLWAPNLPLWLQ